MPQVPSKKPSVEDSLSNPPPTVVQRAEEALETISLGLLMLDQISNQLESFGGMKLIDTAAKMNAQYCALEKYLAPLKERIKSAGLAVMSSKETQTVLKGSVYQATVKSIIKSVLDTERVKKYLGRVLPKYMTQRKETRIDFQIKG